MGKDLKVRNPYSVLGYTPGFPESILSLATTVVLLSQRCHYQTSMDGPANINGFSASVLAFHLPFHALIKKVMNMICYLACHFFDLSTLNKNFPWEFLLPKVA